MNLDPQKLAEEILKGNRRALSRAITLVESTRKDHRTQADELLQLLMPSTGNAIRIGITGVPGVGKSTFIEAIGETIIEQGHRVAVLAVDPSSALSGGSILGDKTRMETLMRRKEAFIRPSPAGTTLGGVARRSFETMLLCEAAGFDVVLVETVGVGQSETRVADMTDIFLLLLLPGGGDELQGIKRGIVELADVMLVNKAEGERQKFAEQTASDYRNALKLLRPRHEHWQVPVQTCSALQKSGMDEVWQTIERFSQMMQANNALEERRAQQSRNWMWTEITERLLSRFKDSDATHALAQRLENEVMQGKLPAPTAAAQLLDAFLAEGEKDD